MKHTGVFLLFAVALTAVAAREPETIMWRNGAWFDGTGFRRVDVYSIGDRLTLKNPSKVDRAVDLTGRFLMGHSARHTTTTFRAATRSGRSARTWSRASSTS